MPWASSVKAQSRVLTSGFGRSRQKQRTRNALKVAAAQLLEDGVSPSIEQVADAALVSRSTAYRYFSSREALEAEVLLDTALRGSLDDVDAAAVSSPDAATRLSRVVGADHQVVTGHEGVFRTALQSFVGVHPTGAGRLTPRPGNRLRYLTAALEPVRDDLGSERFDRLVAALTLCVGIESVVVTRDVCGLSASESEDVKLWAAGALLKQALRDARDGGSVQQPVEQDSPRQ